MTAKHAVQYVRMSTDKQDLSPDLQKQAIAAYAEKYGLEIVASYEDEGRSGIHLKNRPALLRLIHDVTQTKSFEVVLVYDVSRWGRFQDTDAAAYYEYHCRLNGAQVIYVAEMFGADLNPITAMLKSMKRAMAAEYSRELANKVRAGQHQVVSRGFQMGPLPPLGFRRCSVSSDGRVRAPLIAGQRKHSHTDRVEWVLASSDEVGLVRRICDLYARLRLSLQDIARLGAAEGWKSYRGKPMSASAIGTLLKSEALIGNFVWGRRIWLKSLVRRDASRATDVVPRIIDDATWTKIQERMAEHKHPTLSNDELGSRLTELLRVDPSFTIHDLGALGLPNRKTMRARLGPWADCLRRAGLSPEDRKLHRTARVRQRQARLQSLVTRIISDFAESGCPSTYNYRFKVLDLANLRVRVLPVWQAAGQGCPTWPLRPDRVGSDDDLVLVMRMTDTDEPLDYFIAEPADVVARFPHKLTSEVPPSLQRFWQPSRSQAVRRVVQVVGQFPA